MILRAVLFCFILQNFRTLDAEDNEYTIIENCLDKSKIYVNEKSNLKIVRETKDKICINIAVKKTKTISEDKISINQNIERDYEINFDNLQGKEENILLKIDSSSFFYNTKECILIQEESKFNKNKFEMKALSNYRIKCQLKEETINNLLSKCSINIFKNLSIGKIFFNNFEFENQKGFSNIHSLKDEFIKKEMDCEFPNEIEYSLVYSNSDDKLKFLGSYSRSLNKFTITEKNKFDIINFEVYFKSVNVKDFEYEKNKGNNIWDKFIEFFHLLLRENEN